MRGRTIRLSPARRLIGTLMHASMAVPRVTVQRRMNLAPLFHARKALHSRPAWTSIFLKGYALLSKDVPELRRAYVKLPWPHLYEYPGSVASVAHEREIEGERAVLFSRIKQPELCSLWQIGDRLDAARRKPVYRVKEFRQALRLARTPAPLRRLLVWLGLNLGRQRANYFGTFAVSVYSGLGAESLNPLTPTTTLLNYGPIDEAGDVNVRIHYDHRVMDGATIARALMRFEEILNTTLTSELKTMLNSEGARQST